MTPRRNAEERWEELTTLPGNGQAPTEQFTRYDGDTIGTYWPGQPNIPKDRPGRRNNLRSGRYEREGHRQPGRRPIQSWRLDRDGALK